MSLLLPESAPRYSPSSNNEESALINFSNQPIKPSSVKSCFFRMRSKSLIPFHPIPLTLLALTTYSVITVLLLLVVFIPPENIPNAETQRRMDIDVDAAWRDLEYITGYVGYHPYNSRANDNVREYLLHQISKILENNNVKPGDGKVVVVNDMTTNVTFAGDNIVPTQGGLSVYFEGTNIVAVIKGSESEAVREKLGAVLVNSHYDSVSTGYGTTDDGTAVVSLLQLLSYFTNPELPENLKPKRDLLLLWNNGEEDYLNGARAFAVSPLGSSARIFYNLEGAGAGGRATLFRSTDTEVTSFYKHTKRPFGISVSADGFKKGLIRSQTDYKVFTEDLGMRGLDVAFWRPRSRYHTQDDDVRHSSKESLWHMLGGALETVQAMVIDTRAEFESPYGKGGTTGVWFDIFGRAFALFRLHALFAITMSLLTITPFILGLTIYLLYQSNRLYIFSNSRLNGKPTKGWSGFLSFPIAFILSTLTLLGTAFLLVKINPMVIYGHLYLVWICFLSEWMVISWFSVKLVEWWMPSALTRAYTFAWLWLFWYALLIYAAVLEDKMGITAGYFIPVYYTGTFLCLLISLLEQFKLPKKDDHTASTPFSPTQSHRTISSAGHLYSSSIEPVNNPEETSVTALEDSDERTGLLQRNGGGHRPWPTFRRAFHREEEEEEDDHSESETASQREGIYGQEQRWSRDLPDWTWLLQFLLSVPMQIILLGQIGVFLGEALHQTGADGSNLLFVYLSMVGLGILFLLPLMPFMHRIHHYAFMALLFTALISFILSLVVFPFSTDARLKVYFQQELNIHSKKNLVHLVGYKAYLRDIVNSLPSAQGKSIECGEEKIRVGLWRCSWEGITPNLSGSDHNTTQKLVEYKTGKSKNEHKISFWLRGQNTRACKVLFNKPVGWFSVGRDYYENDNNPNSPVYEYMVSEETRRLYKEHAKFTGPPADIISRRSNKNDITSVEPPYQNPVPPSGTKELRLWSREWEKTWRVDFTWKEENNTESNERSDELNWLQKQRGEEEMGSVGKIVCLWSDVNYPGVIPAYDELLKFMPVWSVPSKLGDGLVEGWGVL